MTRDEQLLKTAAAMQADLLSQGYNVVAADNFADGFYEGALYADKNPYPDWHKCDEKMPENTDPVLLYGFDKNDDETWMAVGERDFFNDRWIVYGQPDWMERNVIAWMELPQPPKFD